MQDGTARLLTILSGGLAGALFSFFANSSIGQWRRWQMHRKLNTESAELERRTRTLSVRVRNGYVFPLTGCAGYITLDHELGDVIKPKYKVESEQGQLVIEGAHITDKEPRLLREGKLCWSAEWDRVQETVDLYPGESKLLHVLQFSHDECAAIFSETHNKPYRIWLRGGRSYTGTLKIVCKETKAKEVGIFLQQGALSESIKQNAAFPSNFLVRQ